MAVSWRTPKKEIRTIAIHWHPQEKRAADLANDLIAMGEAILEQIEEDGGEGGKA